MVVVLVLVLVLVLVVVGVVVGVVDGERMLRGAGAGPAGLGGPGLEVPPCA